MLKDKRLLKKNIYLMKIYLNTVKNKAYIEMTNIKFSILVTSPIFERKGNGKGYMRNFNFVCNV